MEDNLLPLLPESNIVFSPIAVHATYFSATVSVGGPHVCMHYKRFCSLHSRERVRWKLASGGQLLFKVHHSKRLVRQRQAGLQESQCRSGLTDHPEEGGLCPEGAADYEHDGNEGILFIEPFLWCILIKVTRKMRQEKQEKEFNKNWHTDPKIKKTNTKKRPKKQFCLSLIYDQKLTFVLLHFVVFAVVALFCNFILFFNSRLALVGFFLSLIFGPVSMKQIFY